MSTPEKREQRLQLLEDDIGRKLAESEASGELRQARGWGQPLDLGDGYEATPTELRMSMKILKDAGVVPAEVELMREIETQRHVLEALPEGATRRGAQQRLSQLQQQLALQMERLRAG